MKSLCLITSIIREHTLLGHLLNYYRGLGVERFLVAVSGRNRPGLPQQVREEYGGQPGLQIVPAAEEYDRTGLATVNNESVRKRFAGPEDWIIPVDLDEFIQFPLPLEQLVQQLRHSDCTHVAGTFVDRLSPEGRLVADLPGRCLFAQFPWEADVTRGLANACCRKVTLVRGDVPLSGGHHAVADGSKCLREDCRVHHFKWRAGLVESLRQRVETYRAQGIWWADESQRILRYLEIHGRIVPEHFTAQMGFRPKEQS